MDDCFVATNLQQDDSEELLEKYREEDRIAREAWKKQTASTTSEQRDNGWNSDTVLAAQSGSGYRRNPNFGRARHKTKMSRQKKLKTIYFPEYHVYTNITFTQKYDKPDNWITSLCRRHYDIECFELEVRTLTESIQPTDEEILKKERFRKSLENLIKRNDQELDLHWGAQVFQTGSSISGLAASGSDVDLCIFIPNARQCTPYGERVNCYRILQIVRHMIYYQHNNEDFPFELKEITLRDAQIPILKIFTECGLESDVSCCCDPFLSGVHNSLLIKGYVDFDDRFAPLATFVKEWAKVTGLKQPTPPNAKFNSYAITMLLIHFLQCGVHPPVLPNLRKKCGPDFYATSQFVFPTQIDLEKMPRPRKLEIPNVMSIPELFIRFCLYYADFNFKDWYISLRESNVLPRQGKKEIELTRKCYIEDPIDQHNPGRTLYDLDGAKFIFRNTAKAFHHACHNQEQFPTVQQILLKEQFENGRFLRIKKTPSPRESTSFRKVSSRLSRAGIEDPSTSNGGLNVTGEDETDISGYELSCDSDDPTDYDDKDDDEVCGTDEISFTTI